MSRAADVVVLGGGIAGLTVALAAAVRGQRVTIVDERRAGAASRAAAGMLAPTVEGLPPAVLGAAIAARDLYPAFLERVHEATGVAVPLDREGILELANDESGLARLEARCAAGAERLDARALARLEPALSGHAGALLYPHDGAVDNVRLMTALERMVELEPRIVRATGSVAALELLPASGALVLADGARHAGGRVVLAGGAWAGDLAGLPRTIPVAPVRGQLLRLETLPIRHVTYGAGGYLIPRGPTLLVGATSDAAGFTNATTPAGLEQLRAIAARAIPSLGGAKVVEHWAGLRPMTPDNLPILGPDPDQPALVYACGFSRNGILLAPWAAELLGALLASGERPPALDPFAIGRFS
jgi:glycine oxidase ThiO